MKVLKRIFARQNEITNEYLLVVDKHLQDIVEGRATDMYELRDIARIMHIHPIHLSTTIKLATGFHPCYFYEQKIMAIAKALLENNKMPINAIADLLTYEPSNFTKFFKRFEHKTPKQYREDFLMLQLPQNT